LASVHETSKPIKDTRNSIGHLGALAGSLHGALLELGDTFDALDGHNRGAARGAQTLRQTSRSATEALAAYPPTTQK
jgi:hypothetical protein